MLILILILTMLAFLRSVDTFGVRLHQTDERFFALKQRIEDAMGSLLQCAQLCSMQGICNGIQYEEDKKECFLLTKNDVGLEILPDSSVCMASCCFYCLFVDIFILLQNTG